MQTGSHQVRDVTEDSTNNGIHRRNNQLPIREPPLTEGLGHVERIDAITFASADMDASVVFYQALGFVISFGDISSPFVTLESGNCFVNLWEVERSALPTRWWGRTIFHVDDVDLIYERAIAAGLSPGDKPKNAPWGERFFPIQDPSGHDLSFAKKLTTQNSGELSG